MLSSRQFDDTEAYQTLYNSTFWRSGAEFVTCISRAHQPCNVRLHFFILLGSYRAISKFRCIVDFFAFQKQINLPELGGAYSTLGRPSQPVSRNANMNHYSYDVEKNPAEAGVGNIPAEKRPEYVYDDGAVPGESFQYGDSIWAKSQRLAGKFKIEQRGIERVAEDERTDNSMLNVGTMVRAPMRSLLLNVRVVGVTSALTDRLPSSSGSPQIWSSPPSPLAS